MSDTDPTPELKSKELPLSFAQCPNCGCEFEDIRIMSIPQFASNLMVSPQTVRGWMTAGKLKFRLWARFGRVHRVILAKDAKAFIDVHLGKPDAPDDSFAKRLWHATLANGHKGWLTRKANDEARKNAQAALTPCISG